MIVLTPASLRAATFELLNITNSLWTYLDNGSDLSGSPWTMLNYTEDTDWLSGRGLFAVNERTAYPFPFSTALKHLGEGGGTTDYFRARFSWDQNITVNPVLSATIHIDDGYIMYLNGVEIDRFNMPDGAVNGFTTAFTVNPGGEPVTHAFSMLLSNLPVSLLVGENVIAVEIHQAATAVDPDKVWGMQLEVMSGSAPEVVSPTDDQIVNILEGASRGFSIEAAGVPDPRYQWEFSTDDGATFNALTNETDATYTVDFMTVEDIGMYRCVLTNEFGYAISPVFDVRMAGGPVPPFLRYACANAESSSVLLAFSEDIFIRDNPLRFLVVDDQGRARHPTNLTVNGSILLMEGLVDDDSGEDSPLDSNHTYQLDLLLSDDYLVTDLFGNALLPNTLEDPIFGVPAVMAPISLSLRFQEGLNGYAGTRDTEVRYSDPDADLGQSMVFGSDREDEGGSVTGLMRFDDLFTANGIPGGSHIPHAILNFWVLNPGDPVGLHRMLIPWTESATWNQLDEGLQADDVEAAALPDAQIDSRQFGVFLSVDVTDTLQAWANGEEVNAGWALISTGNDGLKLASSEAENFEWRPSLSVCYLKPVCDEPPEILLHPNDLTTDQGEDVVFSVLARCGESFQWRRNGNSIPGATEASLRFRHLAGTDGVYDVTVSNQHGLVISDPAILCCVSSTRLGITQSEDSVTLIWDDGALGLLAASSPEGPFTKVLGASSPYSLEKPLHQRMRFFALGE